MKRRDFLKATASVTGAVLPAVSFGQSKPCPPPSLQVQGGTSASTSCVVPSGRVADWEARSGGQGVLWAHRFDKPSAPGLYWGQVVAGTTQGRRCGYLSNDAPFKGPDGLVRADGGIIGDGCMEIYVPANVTTDSIKWGRPIAPTTGPSAVPDLGYTPSSTAGDVNRAGLRLMNFKKFYSMYPGDPGGKRGNGG